MSFSLAGAVVPVVVCSSGRCGELLVAKRLTTVRIEKRRFS
jgi:hypothetical protein